MSSMRSWSIMVAHSEVTTSSTSNRWGIQVTVSGTISMIHRWAQSTTVRLLRLSVVMANLILHTCSCIGGLMLMRSSSPSPKNSSTFMIRNCSKRSESSRRYNRNSFSLRLEFIMMGYAKLSRLRKIAPMLVYWSSVRIHLWSMRSNVAYGIMILPCG
jgi:hypothetical protein